MAAATANTSAPWAAPPPSGSNGRLGWKCEVFEGRAGEDNSPALPSIGDQVIKRHNPDQPLVGVGAVVFKGGEVLLVRRGQEPARDSWSLPGGLVELGETLEAAIQRELAEETGVTVTLLGIAAVLERIFPDPDGRIAYHYVLVDYLCDYLEGELTPGSDITAARFVSLSDLTGFDLPQLTADVIRRAWEQKQQGTGLPLMES